MSRRNVVSIASSHRDAPIDSMTRGLLPWEDGDAFSALRSDFHREHQPKGATETSLTDQLVWLAWRRRRLVVGERAAHLAALQDRLGTDHKSVETVRRAMIATGDKTDKDELSPALAATAEEDEASATDNDADETMTLRAIAILETGDPAGYSEALAALREDTANWWEDIVGDDEQTHPDGKQQDDDAYQPYARNAQQLLRFLKQEAMAIHSTTRGQLSRRPAIRLQAHGESLDPFRMNLLLTIDERLARLFEKTLGMLLKLQELRLSRDPAP